MLSAYLEFPVVELPTRAVVVSQVRLHPDPGGLHLARAHTAEVVQRLAVGRGLVSGDAAGDDDDLKYMTIKKYFFTF